MSYSENVGAKMQHLVGVNITFPTNRSPVHFLTALSMNIGSSGLVGCISRGVMHNCVEDLAMLRYLNVRDHTKKALKIITVFWKSLFLG